MFEDKHTTSHFLSSLDVIHRFRRTHSAPSLNFQLAPDDTSKMQSSRLLCNFVIHHYYLPECGTLGKTYLQKIWYPVELIVGIKVRWWRYFETTWGTTRLAENVDRESVCESGLECLGSGKNGVVGFLPVVSLYLPSLWPPRSTGVSSREPSVRRADKELEK